MQMFDSEPEIKFCSYCGVSLDRDGKYCFACGSLIKFVKNVKLEQKAEIEKEPSPDKDSMRKMEIADKIALKKQEFAVKKARFSDKMELKRIEFVKKKEQFNKKMELKKEKLAQKMIKKKEEFNKKKEHLSKKVEHLFG